MGGGFCFFNVQSTQSPSVCSWKVFSPIFPRPYTNYGGGTGPKRSRPVCSTKTQHYTWYTCVSDYLLFPFETACRLCCAFTQFTKTDFFRIFPALVPRHGPFTQSSFKVYNERTEILVYFLLLAWDEGATHVIADVVGIVETVELHLLKLKF